VCEAVVKIVWGLGGLGYKEISYGDHDYSALISMRHIWQLPALLVEMNISRTSPRFHPDLRAASSPQ
jgi:hypothetical protein